MNLKSDPEDKYKQIVIPAFQFLIRKCETIDTSLLLAQDYIATK